MADKRIDQLDAADPLSGSEQFPVYQDGATKRSDADAVLAYVQENLPPSTGVRVITVGFDGGVVEGVDQSVLINSRIELRAEYGFDVSAWTLLPKAGSTGDITVEIRKRPFSSGSFTAITDGAPPSISSGARGTASVSTWATVDDGDLIEFEITALTGFVSGVVLQLRATQV